MSDFVLDVKPHDVRISWNDADVPAGWTQITRAQAEAIQAIPGQYRTGTVPDIVEMTQAEKDAVDAAAQTAADDSEMTELRLYVYALKKQVRRELNTIRTQVDAVADAVKANAIKAGGMPTPLGDLLGGAFTASIRSRLEEL